MEMIEQKAISLEDIKASSNPVYRLFFSKNGLVKEWTKEQCLFKSIWKGEESKNSFCLKKRNDYGERIPQILMERFSIGEKKTFREKYEEAISGDGKEWTRITTLHSSSLLALLFFYNVTKKNKLIIDKYTFCESYFEVKTYVHDDSESNMDVVLRGYETNDQSKKVVLFLECKFSEYLNAGRFDNISCDAYYDAYYELGLFRENTTGLIFTGDKTTNISIESKDPRDRPLYCGGIKQMISHSMGVSNYALYRKDALGYHSRFKEDKTERVLLGEILYKFDTIITKSKGPSDKFSNYSNAYTELAKIINKKNKIEMFGNLLTYQELLQKNPEFTIEETISKFYGFK